MNGVRVIGFAQWTVRTDRTIIYVWIKQTQAIIALFYIPLQMTLIAFQLDLSFFPMFYKWVEK